MAAAPTMPAMHAPPPVKKGASSRSVLVAALVAFVLLAGGAIAAVMYGTNLFRGGSKNETKLAVAAQSTQSPQRTEASVAATPASVSKPEDALLFQPVNAPATSPAGQATMQPAATTVPPAAVSNQAPPQQTAQATQPRTQVAQAQHTAPAAVAPVVREPKRRALSGVAVAAIGDQPLVGAVSSVLRSEADAAGLDAVDANTLPSTEDMVGRASTRALMDRLRDEGYATLMLARIEPTGSRELSYYGRRDTAYTSRITVTAYDLASGRPVGTPQTESITYTSINMDSESQDVVAPLARAVARSIRNR